MQRPCVDRHWANAALMPLQVHEHVRLQSVDPATVQYKKKPRLTVQPLALVVCQHRSAIGMDGSMCTPHS